MTWAMTGCCGCAVCSMTLPCRFFSAGAAGHLLHHLERPLVGSEIGVVEQRVGAEYAHDAHMGEVEPLGNHLCADEYLTLLLFEVGDNLLVGFAAAGGVEVHAGDGPSRKRAGNLLLDALGAEAVYGNGGLAAGRAAGGHLLLVAAVVAHEGGWSACGRVRLTSQRVQRGVQAHRRHSTMGAKPRRFWNSIACSPLLRASSQASFSCGERLLS